MEYGAQLLKGSGGGGGGKEGQGCCVTGAQ